jgi:hypothetical protein
VERGYNELYETWGACMFRQWKVSLNGYEYCSTHSDPIIRRRAQWHRTIATEMFPLIRSMEVYAPNNTVRKRVRDQRSRYVKLLGEPTFGQRMLEKMVVKAARKATIAELEKPANLYPKEEPFKRYDYHKRNQPGERPYTVSHPTRELAYRVHDAKRRARVAVINGVMQAMANARRLTGRPAAPAFQVSGGRRAFPLRVL